MKVFAISPSGARLAVPVPFSNERRYAFFHGGEGANSWKYCLRLSKRDFPVGKIHQWEEEEFWLLPSVPKQWDEFGNLMHVLKRSAQLPTRECLMLLDMSPGEKGTGVLHSWNSAVRILGHGMEMKPAPHDGGRGARQSVEIDYPVLVCGAGAEFAWERNSGQVVRGGNFEYAACWDGITWRVEPQVPLLPYHAEEHLATRGWVRP